MVVQIPLDVAVPPSPSLEVLGLNPEVRVVIIWEPPKCIGAILRHLAVHRHVHPSLVMIQGSVASPQSSSLP